MVSLEGSGVTKGRSWAAATHRTRMSVHSGTTLSDLDHRDKSFLARLSRAIRESSTGFALGGRFLDTRFSLAALHRASAGRPHLRRGCAPSFPQDRLVAALRWAVEPTAGELEEEHQAICLLAWLVSDETAHLLHTILCDFQMIPWKPASSNGHDPSHAARSLWGSRQAAALEAFDPRLIQAARRSAAELDSSLAEPS